MTNQQPALVSDKHPALSLLIIIALVGIGFVVVGPLLGLLFASAFYDGSLLSAMNDPNPDPSIALPLLITQGVAALVGLIIIPAFYVIVMEKKPLERFFTAENDLKVWGLMAVLGVCFMIAISPVVEWNSHIEFPDFLKSFQEWARDKEDQLLGLTKLLTSFDTFGRFVLSLVVIALIPAVGEEFVFRGLVQTEIQRGLRNPHVAIWLAAIIFSTIHLQFFGFVPRVLLGALFGYMYYWSGNLWIPMFAHFVHNGFTVTMIYLYNIGTVDVNMDSEEAAPWSMVIVTLLVSSFILYFLKNHFARNQDTWKTEF